MDLVHGVRNEVLAVYVPRETRATESCVALEVFSETKRGAFLLSPPTFWEARDQLEPGSFFPRMKSSYFQIDHFVVSIVRMPMQHMRLEMHH